VVQLLDAMGVTHLASAVELAEHMLSTEVPTAKNISEAPFET
jgi:hypothetical protein